MITGRETSVNKLYQPKRNENVNNRNSIQAHQSTLWSTYSNPWAILFMNGQDVKHGPLLCRPASCFMHWTCAIFSGPAAPVFRHWKSGQQEFELFHSYAWCMLGALTRYPRIEKRTTTPLVYIHTCSLIYCGDILALVPFRNREVLRGPGTVRKCNHGLWCNCPLEHVAILHLLSLCYLGFFSYFRQIWGGGSFEIFFFLVESELE